MIRRRFAVLPPLILLILLGPAFARTPLADLQTHNVRRLLATNACPHCDLAGVNLQGAHLIGADLRWANLTDADLSWVNLEGADLENANLTRANLTGAFLTNASFVNADLDGANLSLAELYFVDVTAASLDDLNLAGATIVGTPISVGSGDPPEEEPSVLSPEETWQLPPPEHPQDFPRNLIDVPEEIPYTL